MDFLTPELFLELHHLSWFDGISYIIIGLLTYAVYRWIRSKWK